MLCYLLSERNHDIIYEIEDKFSRIQNMIRGDHRSRFIERIDRHSLHTQYVDRWINHVEGQAILLELNRDLFSALQVFVKLASEFIKVLESEEWASTRQSNEAANWRMQLKSKNKKTSDAAIPHAIRNKEPVDRE